MNPFLKEYATDKTDEELIHFVQEGDRKSLEELLMKHQPYIYNIAWKMVHDPDDAADLAQEAMIKNFDDMASGFDNKGTKTLRTLSKTLCSKHKMPKPLVGRRQMKAVTMIIIIHTFDLCHSRKTKKCFLKQMQERSPVRNKKSAWAVRLDYIYQMIKPKMKGVILYTGKFGSTRQYADWIKEATELPVFDLRKEKPDLSKYDFFILGSSIFIYKPTIRKWLKRHWPRIKGKPVLLFTVSGAEPGSPDLQKWVEDNLGREIIDTITYVPLRGRLKIEELPWYIRFMLKLGANKEEDPEVKKRMVEGFDYMDQSAIQPILEWARSVQKKPAKLV